MLMALVTTSAAESKRKPLVVSDGTDPKQSDRAIDHKVDRPLDKADPLGDLIVRRAQLFQEFRAGKLSQDDLKWKWDRLRNQALEAVRDGNHTYYERQNAYGELLDTGVFTKDELAGSGVQLVDYGFTKEEPKAISA